MSTWLVKYGTVSSSSSGPQGMQNGEASGGDCPASSSRQSGWLHHPVDRIKKRGLSGLAWFRQQSSDTCRQTSRLARRRLYVPLAWLALPRTSAASALWITTFSRRFAGPQYTRQTLVKSQLRQLGLRTIRARPQQQQALITTTSPLPSAGARHLSGRSSMTESSTTFRTDGNTSRNDVAPSNCESLEQLEASTDMMAAVEMGRVDSTISLLEKGALVNFTDSTGSTALMHACCHGDIRMVDLLLERHADVNKENTWKETALHMASSEGHFEVVQRLLQHDANVNAVNAYGNNPLMLATDRNREMIMTELIHHGADVSHQNELQEPALHMASYNGNLSAVRALVEAGANVNLRSVSGRTALHELIADTRTLAPYMLLKYRHVFYYLTRAGAHVDIPDHLGHTILDYASDESHWLMGEYTAHRDNIGEGALELLSLRCSTAHVICKNQLPLTTLPPPLQEFVHMHKQPLGVTDTEKSMSSEEAIVPLLALFKKLRVTHYGRIQGTCGRQART